MPARTPKKGNDAPAFNRRVIPEGAAETKWKAADNWEIRRLDWRVDEHAAVHPRGSILFLPGRGDIYEKYLETFQHFHVNGWNVTSSDWRGQGGSGRYASSPYVGHIADFAMWVADLKQLYARWKAETFAPHVVIGHSMGGHLVARALIEKAIDPDAAVLIAPMLGMAGPRLPLPFSQLVAWLTSKISKPDRPAWRVSEKPASPLAIRQTLLTHDDDRYGDELYWWGLRPEVVMGPGSWTWVERAYASMRKIFAAGTWESVTIPVYVVATTNDQLVRYGAIVKAVERMQHAELLTFGNESRHEILREADAVRDRALAGIDAFLKDATLKDNA